MPEFPVRLMIDYLGGLEAGSKGTIKVHGKDRQRLKAQYYHIRTTINYQLTVTGRLKARKTSHLALHAQHYQFAIDK